MSKQIHLLAPFLLLAAVTIAGARIPLTRSQPSLTLTSTAAFRPATLLFTPNQLTLSPGQKTEVLVSLDSSGLPVSSATLQFQIANPTANLSLSSPAPGCSIGNGLALTCQFQENTAETQIIPLATLDLTEIAIGQTVVSVSKSSISSPTLPGINRLRYLPQLNLHVGP